MTSTIGDFPRPKVDFTVRTGDHLQEDSLYVAEQRAGWRGNANSSIVRCLSPFSSRSVLRQLRPDWKDKEIRQEEFKKGLTNAGMGRDQAMQTRSYHSSPSNHSSTLLSCVLRRGRVGREGYCARIRQEHRSAYQPETGTDGELVLIRVSPSTHLVSDLDHDRAPCSRSRCRRLWTVFQWLHIRLRSGTHADSRRDVGCALFKSDCAQTGCSAPDALWRGRKRVQVV